MSIRNNAEWPEIAKHIKIEIYAPDGGYKNPRFRLEFNNLVTQQQKLDWIQIMVPCVSCGQSIHPIRERKPSKPTERGANAGHIYLAPCCPLNVNVGCSRGNAAHNEYLMIRKDVEQLGSIQQLTQPTLDI